ncbi:MAG: YheC/YheD family protein [Negativicutes bacterium]|nr:YheC/YheD family protein [Negativicutes bacterium]
MPVIHETERQDMELLRPSNTTIWPLQGFRDGKWQICHSRREALQSAWQKFAVLTSSPGASESSTLAEADSADGQAAALPVFGILYREISLNNREAGFGFEDYHFRQLARLSANYGFRTVVFAAKGLDYERKTLQGYSLTPYQEWQPGCFPLPAVIYYRGVSIFVEENSERMQALQQLSSLGIPSLNNSLFTLLLDHKLNFYRFLQQTALSPFLPETREYSAAALWEMQKRHRVLFFKPIAGYESRGLLRLQQLEPGWQLDYNDDNGIFSTQTLNSPENLLLRLEQITQNQDYLIQAGIPSFLCDHSVFEQRILMQRCKKKWLQACHVLRSSGTPDLPFITAAREITADAAVLKNLLTKEQQNSMKAQIQTAVRGLTQLFGEKPYEASEFSCDFMLDTKGKIWLLECNAKPSGFFIQTGDLDGRMAYLRHTLQQAVYLAEQDQAYPHAKL